MGFFILRHYNFVTFATKAKNNRNNKKYINMFKSIEGILEPAWTITLEDANKTIQSSIVSPNNDVILVVYQYGLWTEFSFYKLISGVRIPQGVILPAVNVGEKIIFSRDGKNIVFSFKNELKSYNLEEQEIKVLVTIPLVCNICDFSMSADNQLIAVLSGNDQITIHNNKGNLLRTLQGVISPIKLQFNFESSMLAVLSRGAVALFDISTCRPLYQQKLESYVESYFGCPGYIAGFTKSNRLIVMVGTIIYVLAETGAIILQFGITERLPLGVDSSLSLTNSSLLVVTSKEIYLWNIYTGALISQISNPRQGWVNKGQIVNAYFTPDGKRIIWQKSIESMSGLEGTSINYIQPELSSFNHHLDVD